MHEGGADHLRALARRRDGRFPPQLQGEESRARGQHTNRGYRRRRCQSHVSSPLGVLTLAYGNGTRVSFVTNLHNPILYQQERLTALQLLFIEGSPQAVTPVSQAPFFINTTGEGRYNAEL